MSDSQEWISSRLISSAQSSPVSWIIEDYIPASTVTLISSVSGSGKSILGMHMGLSILAGLDWLGMKVRQSSFAYWDQDNPDAWLTDNRICAIRRGLDLKPGNLPEATVFRTSGPVIGHPHQVKRLINWLLELHVEVLFVDTLSSVSRKSEGDPGEMSAVINDNFFPMVEAGITPLIFHHIGKDFMDKNGKPIRRTGIHAARGSSALIAAVGAAFNLDRSGDDRTLECVKPRYGYAPLIKLAYDESGFIGSEDWKITILNSGKKVSAAFLTHLIGEHKWQKLSSRKLVEMIKLRGYSVSQSTAAKALSEFS